MTYSFPEFTKGKIGEFDYTQLNAMFAILERVSAILPFLERLKRERRQPQPNPWFFAEITGHTLIPSSTNRWLYRWRKVVWNPNDYKFDPMMAPKVTSGGRPISAPPTSAITPTPPTGTQSITLVEVNSAAGTANDYALAAINGCENPNINDGMVGPGVNTGASNYTGCNLEVKPIMDGVIVPMFHAHGKLSRQQVTGERSVFAYMFNVPNAHDKVDAP